MSPRPSLLALLFLSACGSTPAKAPAPAAASAAAPAPASASAPALPPEPSDLLVVTPPPSRGCELARAPFPQDALYRLATAPDGEKIAYARGPADVKVVVGPSAYVVVSTPQVTVRGYAVEPLGVFATRPIVFAGCVVAGPSASLAVASVDGDRVIVSAPESVASVDARPLTATVACSDIALEASRFDATTAAPAGKALRKAHLPATEVLLSTEPAGAPAAKLPFAYRPRPVDVLALRGKRAQIVWSSPAAIAFGWIDAAALSADPPSGAAVITLEDAVGQVSENEPLDQLPQRSAPEHRTCDADVRLIAETRRGARTRRWVMGSLAAKTPIAIYERDETLAYVNPPQGSSIAFPAEIRLAVAAREVAACPMR